ncbi:MAG: hypothetical protein HC897_07855 [Thermoanaerobaculia bacterium]|nr:hypothetical protein [Thermoanaerobaculia bacterium]
MSVVKTIGKRGQITIGKQYAGKHVLVDELELGVWLLKLGDFVPANEQWLHRPEAKAKLDRAIAWAETRTPATTNLDELESQLRS